ncbi:MAG: DUF2336 domain-containing protein [Alphaproteobacteria bacterium]
MTSQPNLNMNELLDLARDKSVDGRTRLVQLVGDLFFDEGRILNTRERALMTDILRQLIHDVEMSVRRSLADKLSREANAPAELVTVLANDEIEVAHSILMNSSVLQDLELIEIIQHRTFQHRLTIAMRQDIAEPVTDALVETDNTMVIQTLIENDSAQISPSTMVYLVDQSETRDAYQKPLLDRADLGAPLAKRMYWWVSAALRTHIVEHYDVDPTELDQNIESTIKTLIDAPHGGATGKLDNRPLEEAAKLSKKVFGAQTITPETLLQTLRQGEVRLFEGMLAQTTDLRPNLARRLIYEPGGEGLAIACRAIGMTKADFGSLFLLSRSARPDDKSVDPDEVARAMSFFDRIKVKTAKIVLARWRLDPDYLFAIEQIQGANELKAAAE